MAKEFIFTSRGFLVICRGMQERLTPRKIKAALGSVLGASDWMTLDQKRIDAFAECTGDRQWIHVDVERAAQSPLGGTVAHGLLLLSLLPGLRESVPLLRMKCRMLVLYGFNRVRFTCPVNAGRRVRTRALLKSVERRGFRKRLLTLEVTMDIENESRPALAAELLFLVVL